MMKYYVLIFFSLIISACSSTKGHNNYRYGKKPQILQQPTLLRTDGVYLSEEEISGKKNYFFIRFYGNGRCYVSDMEVGNPSIDSLSTQNKRGEKTYFRNKTNEVSYEIWGGYNSGYMYIYYKLDSIGMESWGYKTRGMSSFEKYPRPTKYAFIPINFKTKEASW
ncbi:MAG: hypothetical protein J0I41_17205 [Filimonas sp.]|nr:hypothetical protein [Filimonas sp.]